MIRKISSASKVKCREELASYIEGLRDAHFSEGLNEPGSTILLLVAFARLLKDANKQMQYDFDGEDFEFIGRAISGAMDYE